MLYYFSCLRLSWIRSVTKRGRESFLPHMKRAVCGAGCAKGLSNGDPCVNLEEEAGGRYRCRAYEGRLGTQKTVSGRTFTCVSARDALARGLVFSCRRYGR